MSNRIALALLVSFFYLSGCTSVQTQAPDADANPAKPSPTPASVERIAKLQNPGKVVHALVALCDNENQGIVKVPPAIGNGEDPPRNLYWGAKFGIRTHFSRSPNWTKIAEFANPKDNVLERLVFKHRTANVYLVADAYRGSKMKETIDDFFGATGGGKRENIEVDGKTIQILGGADIVAFIGHNGLMDFDLDKEPELVDSDKREAIVLACASRNYFFKPLRKTSATPLLWTTNLMAPEAYILHDALEGWTRGETDAAIRERAANAYAKYQRINVNAARNLLVTGW